MDYAKLISEKLSIQSRQVTAVIELTEADNTLPFIARYRKEATGSLDEEQLRQVISWYEKMKAVDERRSAILASIEEQGKLTPELQLSLARADTLTALEDLYQPYKPKRKTRASMAREKGLGGLADLLLQQARTRLTLAEIAAPFLNDQVATLEEAWAGARDIVAEMISDHAEVRRVTREKAMQWGVLHSEKAEGAEDPKGIYQTYYEFECRVDRLRPHQVLALNRGEGEKALRIHLEVLERDWRNAIAAVFLPDRLSPLAEQMDQAVQDAAERLLLPAIERDVRRALKESAEEHAIQVFAENLRALLNQPPLAGYTVLGIDPGFRTGSKVAVVDATGKVLDTATIYPHPPQNEREKSLRILAALVQKHHIDLIAIGNGTASRETEELAATLIRGGTTAQSLIVNEAGASVYSASPLARAELPDLDVTMRGAVSIARRVLDPLAELVKIDPRSIGVGLYQHDVDQKALVTKLDEVIESVVNRVGVNVNTASPALLQHVAGLGPKLAERLVELRDAEGRFPSRLAIRRVKGMGDKTFEQAAGFLRIPDGDTLLDNTGVHPESYPVVEKLLKRLKLDLSDPDLPGQVRKQRPALDIPALAEALNVGVPTLEDILGDLTRPGRDPRSELDTPVLRSDVLSMDDLKPGMKLTGTVRNVVDFGAFVDIGVKQDGLVHISEMADFYVKDPYELVDVGDVIEVTVLSVDVDRKRIALSMRA